ncbi:hypothetical protein TNCV_112561 [Trichonephila clavipes]|nr:hypothetical protein TNCV_112561 [Trichonephila clavipes]
MPFDEIRNCFIAGTKKGATVDYSRRVHSTEILDNSLGPRSGPLMDSSLRSDWSTHWPLGTCGKPHLIDSAPFFLKKENTLWVVKGILPLFPFHPSHERTCGSTAIWSTPCCEDTLHLQISVPSPRFEPRLYGTAVSIANHYTGWATSVNVPVVFTRCSSPVTNRGCNFFPSMTSTPSITNAASVVAQSKKDHVPGLGREEGQETKLKTFTSLKIKGYNIFRLDRQNRCGGGLAFLIKNINYQCININRKITDGSNLEIQGIRIIWRGKPLNIFNMYHPPDLKSLPTDLQDLLTGGTICLGDLNAKHPIWGCSTANLRGNELLDIIDDKCFSILNDGTATHFSYSYNAKEALDISITSSDLGPSCKWTLLENLGSHQLPVLIELKKRQLVPTSNNKQLIFKKAGWQSFAQAVDNGIQSIPLMDSVDLN